MESADESGSSTQRSRSIASQACNTCRQRKTKCDERRPKCGLCDRINATCLYQEPKPIKKDKTLQEILSTLDMLHRKVDRIDRTVVKKTPGSSQSQSTRSFSSFDLPHKSGSEVQKVLSWPAVEKLLRFDLDEIHQWDQKYTSTEEWLARITDDFGRPFVVEGRVDLVTEGSPYFELSGAPTMLVSNEMIEDLTSAFFSSFHCIYPIIDQYHFNNKLLPRVRSQCFEESNEASPLVLLVLALGCVAQQGTIGEPISDELTGRKTGVKGGEVEVPPGLRYLQEALRRMGLLLPRCSLIIVQCHLLAAIYYSQCSRNLEYWRMTEWSCTLCRSLIKMSVRFIQTIIPSNDRRVHEWTTAESALIKRSYWMCVLLESGPTGELGLSRTGITKLQDEIPMLDFGSYSEREKEPNELLVEYHFLAQITLRTLLNRINNSLRSRRSTLIVGTSENPPANLIDEFAAQLQEWRIMLPQPLQWVQDATLGSSAETAPVNNIVELKADGLPYGMLDPILILTASLQTRYKFAEYMIYRPYLYKALHTPESVTKEDLRGCAQALHACTLWPLLLPVFQAQKRLLPHLYEYSHTFFSILVLLHVCKTNTVLQPILQSDFLLNRIEDSTGPLLQWLRDMQVVHPVAAWCWALIKVLYRDHPAVTE